MSIYLTLSERLQTIEKQVVEALKDTPANGYSIKQLLILEQLYTFDSRKASDLAKSIGQPTTSFTPLLDSLEIHSLIARVADPEDRRAVRIVLTATAKRAAFKNAVLETLDQIETKYGKWA